MTVKSLAHTGSKASRNTTLATRVSQAEAQAVEAAAKAAGLSRSNWLHKAAMCHLDQLELTPYTELKSTLVGEIRALRLVVANLFLKANLGIPIDTAVHILNFGDSVRHIEAAKALRSSRASQDTGLTAPLTV